MTQFIRFSNYSPAADIVVAAICLVMMVLVYFSNISRTRSFKLFLTMVALVLAAAWTDMMFYILAAMPGRQMLANWMRCIHHVMLLLVFVYYIAYICDVTRYEKQKWFLFLANLVFVGAMAADVITTAQGITFAVDDTGISFDRRGIFIYAYLGYTILCVILLANVRKLLFHRVMLGFYGTVAISIGVLVIQGFSNQSSFTVSSQLLPVVAMMYVLHSNPYDALLGANDKKAMQDYVGYCYSKKQDFVFMSLYMKELDEEGKELPHDMQVSIRHVIYQFARSGRLFKAGNGHVIFFMLKKQYPNYEKRIKSILDAFHPLYEKFRYDYKMVVGESVDQISQKNEYVSYIRNIHRKMAVCSIHRADTEDVDEFNLNEDILMELADIYRQGNLDDPRVLVYCQPVLNVKTGKYDTAEALMRLNLEEIGIVFPDQFIHLAEEQGYIHILTEIILHKTCDAIRHLSDAGYAINRISVNISVPELKDENFCGDIINIINKSGISGDKIALELTESQNEGDFMLMKQKIGDLKETGIKFYLDDFGTGYSNMERIMSLPFDIIKFDKSLVIASGTDQRSEQIVENLAHMFEDMDYSVLYEGVENSGDEERCREMSASYLQGFKYSKPVPIEQITAFL